jgi:hypothetical protein
LVPLLNFFMPTQKQNAGRLQRNQILQRTEKSLPAAPRICFSVSGMLGTQCDLYNPVELQQNFNEAIFRLRRRFAQANRIQTQGRI